MKYSSLLKQLMSEDSARCSKIPCFESDRLNTLPIDNKDQP